MVQILFCESSTGVRVVYLIKMALNIIRFALPIILILKVIFDIYKNIITDNDKENVVKTVFNRILACVIIFCVPTLINLVFRLLDETDILSVKGKISFTTCYNEANLELVSRMEETEALKLKEEEEAERLEDSIILQNYYAELEAREEYNLKYQATLNNKTWNSNLTDLNKQNGVYVQDGVFYKPSGPSGKNCPSGDPTKQGYKNKYGYNDHFFEMLTNLQTAAAEAGYKFTYSHHGCRSYSDQEDTAKKYANEPGRAAKPGNSNHGWGVAADLDFESSKAEDWVHAHAKEYGLHFPLYGEDYDGYQEPWHIEPINLKTY